MLSHKLHLLPIVSFLHTQGGEMAQRGVRKSLKSYIKPLFIYICPHTPDKYRLEHIISDPVMSRLY
jgi:hypothetical protein